MVRAFSDPPECSRTTWDDSCGLIFEGVHYPVRSRKGQSVMEGVFGLVQAAHGLEVGGRWDAAEAAYRQLAGVRPNLLYPRYRLVSVLANRGDWNGVVEVVEALRAEAPGNARITDWASRIAAEGGSGFPPHVARAGLWRRWFLGEASWHEGEEVASSDLAVVVISHRAQPTLPATVESLLDQKEPLEVVVVNSGGGDPVGILTPFKNRLRIINVEERLFAGAVRNIGIDASMAPYVALLAADCRARPGWAQARLATHAAGARAVASAVVPEEQPGSASIAAHLSLFGARLPLYPPAQVQRYPGSFARNVFAEFGYFNPGLRIGEDTDFLTRVGASIRPAWNPKIQTEHGGPRTAWMLASEMYRRGQRAARYQSPTVGNDTSAWPLLTSLVSMAKRRTRTAASIGRHFLPVSRSHKIGAHLALANTAYASGVGTGLLGLRRAESHFERSLLSQLKGDRGAALREAGLSVLRDGENFKSRLHYAELLLAIDDDASQVEAQIHLRAACWLAFARPSELVDLANAERSSGLTDMAWRLGEAATYMSPMAADIHGHLATAAHDLHDRDAFELAAFDAAARGWAGPIHVRTWLEQLCREE